LPPTSTNVSVDPITDAGRRAGCGYRRGMEAATRDGEQARSRYAFCSSQPVVSRVAPLPAEQKNADHAGTFDWC